MQFFTTILFIIESNQYSEHCMSPATCLIQSSATYCSIIQRVFQIRLNLARRC